MVAGIEGSRDGHGGLRAMLSPGYTASQWVQDSAALWINLSKVMLGYGLHRSAVLGLDAKSESSDVETVHLLSAVVGAPAVLSDLQHVGGSGSIQAQREDLGDRRSGPPLSTCSSWTSRSCAPSWRPANTVGPSISAKMEHPDHRESIVGGFSLRSCGPGASTRSVPRARRPRKSDPRGSSRRPPSTN